jgi:putative lysine transport system permease protein
MSLPSDYFGRIIYIIQNYGDSLLRGAGTTLLIAVVSTFVGCIIGLVCGIIQTIPVGKNDNIAKKIVLFIVKLILNIYVEVFRGTPMMVQAVFIYYGASMLFNINMDFMFAAFFIVSINTGAYMAETVRGGILSIDEGQTEGAKSIGMTHFQTMLYVILPQAIRNIMPQIGNNLIINIKDTCVLSVISVVELFFASKSVAGSYYIYFETYTVTMVMYLIMTVFFSRLLRYIEKRMDGPKSYELATRDTITPTSGMIKFRGRNGGTRGGF